MLKWPVENPMFQGTEASCQQPCEDTILAAAPPAPVEPSDETAALSNSTITTSLEILSQKHIAGLLLNP